MQPQEGLLLHMHQFVHFGANIVEQQIAHPSHENCPYGYKVSVIHESRNITFYRCYCQNLNLRSIAVQINQFCANGYLLNFALCMTSHLDKPVGDFVRPGDVLKF